MIERNHLVLVREVERQVQGALQRARRLRCGRAQPANLTGELLEPT